jgi:hypothetical protein
MEATTLQSHIYKTLIQKSTTTKQFKEINNLIKKVLTDPEVLFVL